MPPKAKKRPRTKRANKYPILFGCFVDIPGGFVREYDPKEIQGKVVVVHYKGRMLLSAEGGPHENRAVWLDGEDIDELIKILREAKREWLKAYRKTKSILKKQGHL